MCLFSTECRCQRVSILKRCRCQHVSILKRWGCQRVSILKRWQEKKVASSRVTNTFPFYRLEGNKPKQAPLTTRNITSQATNTTETQRRETYLCFHLTYSCLLFQRDNVILLVSPGLLCRGLVPNLPQRSPQRTLLCFWHRRGVCTWLWHSCNTFPTQRHT